MVKLVYDYQIFSRAKYGGIARYIYEIATRTAKTTKFEVEIFAGVFVNGYLQKSDKTLVRGHKVPYFPGASRVLSAANAELSKCWFRQSKVDLLHETYYSQKCITPKRCTTILTVYDMIHEKFSYLMSNRERELISIKAAAINRADYIICISEATKNDLISLLNIDPKKVIVTYLGHSLRSNISSGHSKVINVPYILYVGRRDKYKNFDRLIEAYANNSRIRQEFSLVSFGGKSFSKIELSKISELGLPNGKVIHLEGNDSTLAGLYSHAAALAYPSLYEGFGIPPIEAMSFGCPVICSNVSSIPEVVAEAGEYFDPYNVDNIADALEKVLFSTERTMTLSMLGKERAKKFSWENCAEQTQLVYSSLLQN
ncbi:MAG: glycosyltransferase family 4 protein [Myxacorys californica WJT36-NPBG1]|jgi:glycosyltransferase involved in cell wall biosynthesis|nr:glycosyltransferase family 4 protein [Myxacorys californica WJT36-NPBG1]